MEMTLLEKQMLSGVIAASPVTTVEQARRFGDLLDILKLTEQEQQTLQLRSDKGVMVCDSTAAETLVTLNLTAHMIVDAADRLRALLREGRFSASETKAWVLPVLDRLEPSK